MIRTVFASAALVAAAHAAGDAIVINNCKYDVHMSNVPASGGGYSNIDKVLSSGNTYSQPWTQLSNGNGWSIKLSKEAGAFGDNILQYEYTFHNDGTIWYDLSEVNGNPWDKNWEITANNGCKPRQAAYRYATDDAYGMQSCADDASITVTVCSGEEGGSAPEPSSPAETWTPAPTSAAPAPSTSDSNWGGWGESDSGAVEAPAAKMAVAKEKPEDKPAKVESEAPAAPTSEAAWDGPAVTVTNIHMETLTKYVTATEAPAAKRHVHHPRHPFHR
jgi:hypothetical protein